MRNLQAAFLLTVYLMTAHGAELKDCAGTWAMRVGQRNLFVLNLTLQGTELRGSLEGPAQITSHNGLFANMTSRVRRDLIVRSRFADGVLHFTVQNSTNPKDEDGYRLVVNGAFADMVLDLPPDAIMRPRRFERTPPGTKVATDWEPNRIYTQGDSDIPSAEMKAIFDEDQRVRQAETADWTAINRSDAERRLQTRKLLDSGALHTGRDYEEAAFVFQHGNSPDDYLLAHTLAMVAISKGQPTAIWIATATLDRYFQNSGQKQIFGTQYKSDPQGNWTQEPYNKSLVSDALRLHLGALPQALQDEQIKAFQRK